MPKTVAAQVTDDEAAYSREFPDEIDEFTSSVNIALLIYLAGAVLGLLLVALSKAMKYSTFLAEMSAGWNEFFVDVVFEAGVALTGAVVTAYILEHLLNKRQEQAIAWRKEIRRRIDQEG
jgi:hypothetical protein